MTLTGTVCLGRLRMSSEINSMHTELYKYLQRMADAGQRPVTKAQVVPMAQVS